MSNIKDARIELRLTKLWTLWTEYKRDCSLYNRLIKTFIIHITNIYFVELAASNWIFSFIINFLSIILS